MCLPMCVCVRANVYVEVEVKRSVAAGLCIDVRCAPPHPHPHLPLEAQLCGIVCQWDKGMAPSVLLYGPVTRINYKPIESAAANW